MPSCATPSWSSLPCMRNSRPSPTIPAPRACRRPRAGQIDLVIMDVGLPDMDGREAVRILRKNGFKAPIIMLTGHDTDSDTILGLEFGRERLRHQAVPFRGAAGAHPRAASPARGERGRGLHHRALHASVRARRSSPAPKGNKVRLTEKETAILRYLYRAGQKPVSRETLLQEVWGYNSGVTTHTLETHVYRLRQKVEKDAANPVDPGDRCRRLQARALDQMMPIERRHQVPGAACRCCGCSGAPACA